MSYEYEYSCSGSLSSPGNIGGGGSSGNGGNSLNDFEEAPGIDISSGLLGICPGTFEYTQIGDGYTTQVTNVIFKMFDSRDGRIMVVPIGNLCIQVRNRNSTGQFISTIAAAVSTAEAWGVAQNFINQNFKWDRSYTVTAAKNDFLDVFRRRLEMEFGGFPTITNANCSGDVISNEPIYDIFCFF